MVIGNNSDAAGSVNRRRFLQAVSVVSAAGLAGCGSDPSDGTESPGTTDGNGGGNGNGNGSGDLGERVPRLNINYWSDQGNPTILFETGISILEEDIGDLGLSLNPIPTTTGDGIDSQAVDDRSFHFAFNSYGPTPNRLDPDQILNFYHINNAGANDPWNPSNYANCDYSELVEQQGVTGDPEERRAVVDEAFGIFSEDIPIIPLVDRLILAAINTAEVDAIDAGQMGLIDTAIPPILELSATGANGTVNANLPSEYLTTDFYPLETDASTMQMWSLVWSPLIWYNKNYELEGNLAESWEVTDEGTRFTFTLHNATFHNGDPVTPEDVKWTFEFLSEQYDAGTYQWTAIPPFDAINVIDDRTVEFITPDASPTLETVVFPQIGILPQGPLVEAGIEDDPAGFENPRTGSGPFQIAQFQPQQFVALEPHGGHPTYSPESTLILQVFDSVQTVRRAFQNNELNVAMGLDPSSANQIAESGNSVEIVEGAAFVPFNVHPSMSFAPGKFREFRHAFSRTLDRAAINETYAFGRTSELLYSSFLSPVHPWYTEEVLTQIAEPAGDVEAARQILSDAGWGWDDNGNLHYPADADLSPMWPQGEGPDPADFPCLS